MGGGAWHVHILHLQHKPEDVCVCGGGRGGAWHVHVHGEGRTGKCGCEGAAAGEGGVTEWQTWVWRREGGKGAVVAHEISRGA